MIVTAFYPLKQHERNFSKSLTKKKMYFSIGIYLCPMDHLHLVGLFITRLPVFQWKAKGYDWSLVDSI